MKSLINFINNIRFLIAFLVLQGVSFLLIANGSGFQKTAIVNSANNISGWFYNQERNIRDYFNLVKINKKLQKDNTVLKQRTLKNYQIISNTTIKIGNDTLKLQYEYLPAKIIRSSTSGKYNVLTLNKGSSNGIKKEMAIVTTNGVVGFVRDISTNLSTVISVMNQHFKITTKPKNKDLYGSFIWRNEDEINTGTIEKIPAYIKIAIGDTMITRQAEGIFPEGEILGYVTHITEEPESNYKTLKIKTAQDFNALNNVFVIKNILKKELDSLVLTQ